MPLDANVDPIVTEAIVTEAGSAVEVDPVTDEVIPLVEETPVKKVFPEVPPEVEYLIVGGGTAAYSAVRAIRKYDPTAKILIVSDEPEMPYNRTPLSKELWFETEENAALGKYKGWDDKERVIFHEKLENYCTGRDLQEREGYGGTALLLGAKVDRLDADRKKAVLYNGTEIGYGKVLLSIGGKPKNLPEFKNVSEKVTLFRDLKDFRQLSEISQKGGDVVVVGSGFLGTELSYALAERAKKVENLNVSQICREQGVLGAVLPEHLSNFSSEVLEKEGVNIIRNAEIAGVSEDSDKLSINLKDGRSVPADHVVLAVGVDIDHGLAERSGLEVDSNRGGFIVNSELESRKDIFVAGDAANFYDQRLGRRRVEHYDHAIVTGRLAGENMVGMRKAYTHQSMFWSDIGADNGFEAIGLVDSKLKSVSVFAQPEEQNTEGGNFNERKFDKGVVFYLRNENVVGVVTWNIFGKMGVARRLLAHNSEELDFAEMARLFNVHK